MDDNICVFSRRSISGSVTILNLVQEKHVSLLPEELRRDAFILYIVSGGSGEFSLGGQCYALSEGDLFFTFPEKPFRITDRGGLQYIYVSFVGASAPGMLESLGVSMRAPIFSGFSSLLPFWRDATAKCSEWNLPFLAEGVLMYTLAHLVPASRVLSHARENPTIAAILKYTDEHYSEPEFSLSLICERFFYNPKYISSLFKREVGVRFAKYLNLLRISRACAYMDSGFITVGEIAELVGYKDPLYFSKLFRTVMGCTPSEYIKNQRTGVRRRVTIL